MGSIPALLMKLGLGSGSDHDAIVSINLFVTLLCVCIVLGHLLEESKWINESITALIIGLSTGCVILLTTGGKSSRILVFSEDLFFNYLLPPIIFNAGFQVKKKQFFRNFGTITFFGALGTIISFVIISAGAYLSFRKYDITPLESADYLAIGVIFSATDSVCTLQVLNQAETPLLYSLVFGEGVVNDATSVVLFNAVQSLDLGHINSTNIWTLIFKFLIILGSSTGLGVAIGLTSAYAIKKLYFGRHSTDREVALMILMSYLSYMLAEVWGSYFSAILTVFFCGIVMSHYTWHNVTESSRITTKHAFATMSFIAETFIFLYVGMDALDIEKWRLVVSSPGKTIGLSSMLLVLVMLGRAAFVFPLSLVANLLKNAPSEKINFKQQVIIWWAGLMRGSVSMALAYNQFTRSGHTQLQGNAIMITCTITLVLFSTMVFGMLTKPLVRLLLPHDSNTINGGSASESSSPKSFLIPFFGDVQYTDTSVRRPTSLRLLLTMPTSTVHYYWRKFDDAYMRPMFGGRGFVPFVPGSPTEGSSNQHSAFLQ